MSYFLRTTPEPGHFFRFMAPRGLSEIITVTRPDGSISEVHCANLQWYMNGKPVEKPPFLKSGYMRKNLVAQSVAAALYGGEWMTIRNGLIEFEDGVRCTMGEFWHFRKEECWQTGYSVWKGGAV